LFRRGFTLIEILIVIAIVMILASLAVPNFSQNQRKTLARQNIQDVFLLIQEARTAAISSKTHARADQAESVPTGGYGVYIDTSSNVLTFFVDDWNAAQSGVVSPERDTNPLDPDHTYTAGSDTSVNTLTLNPDVGISNLKASSTGSSVALSKAALIFTPPLAETFLNNNESPRTDFIDLYFDIGLKDGSLKKTMHLNRISGYTEVQ
jgi:prepilin-type N-terminal cleavage/methylation domain-containing protein